MEEQAKQEKLFYDIHCHAFNLSHPNLLAFVRRLEIPKSWALLLYYVLGPLLPFFLMKLIKEKKVIKTYENLLSILENDIGSIFHLMDQCMHGEEKHLIKDGKLSIGGNTYDRMVLTPLLMDFGYKNLLKTDIHYRELPEKPIVEQVIDVFNGIKKYQRKHRDNGLFLIYPFLGINTKNYELRHVEKMLEKYFGTYQGNESALREKMGQFTGDIDEMRSNFFAGVKVYPLLGFDPWPDGDLQELKKVQCLYEYCMAKQIPITSHCSDEGFTVVEKKDGQAFSSVEKWAKVLSEYPELKVNLAHFGSEKKKTRPQLDLIMRYENFYVDISYIAYEDAYYQTLRGLIDGFQSAAERERVMSRVLFGSDFMMSLKHVNSYSGFVQIFDKTKYFTSEEKNILGSRNPERFLFHE